MQRRPDDVLVEIFEGDCLVVLLPKVPDERPEVVFGLRRLGKHVHRDLEDDGLPGGHRLSNVGIDCVVVPIKKKISAELCFSHFLQQLVDKIQLNKAFLFVSQQWKTVEQLNQNNKDYSQAFKAPAVL